MALVSIAVVTRRGADFWPCTKRHGGPVCRVGGKLHHIPQMPRGVRYPNRSKPCAELPWVQLGALWWPSHCYPPRTEQETR